VHMESYPKADNGAIVREGKDFQKIRQILTSNSNIRKVSTIRIYESKAGKRVDVTCSFVGSDSIEKVHREISLIEGEIKKSIGECTLTIHAEPV